MTAALELALLVAGIASTVALVYGVTAACEWLLARLRLAVAVARERMADRRRNAGINARLVHLGGRCASWPDCACPRREGAMFTGRGEQ